MVRNAEQFREFGLEMPERAEAGAGGIDVVERAGEQIVELGIGVLRLDRRFQKLTAICGQQRRAVMSAQSFAPMADGNFAQRVKVAAPRLGVGNFAAEKKVEFSRERAFRAESSFGHRFDQSMIRREPVDDQAGVGQSGQAGKNGGQNGDRLSVIGYQGKRIWEIFLISFHR